MFRLYKCAAWWYKPEYIINELNINSVITTPGHGEILPINATTTQRAYTMRGYAYAGESIPSALTCLTFGCGLEPLILVSLWPFFAFNFDFYGLVSTVYHLLGKHKQTHQLK